jgi:hypothetical protein
LQSKLSLYTNTATQPLNNLSKKQDVHAGFHLDVANIILPIAKAELKEVQIPHT